MANKHTSTHEQTNTCMHSFSVSIVNLGHDHSATTIHAATTIHTFNFCHRYYCFYQVLPSSLDFHTAVPNSPRPIALKSTPAAVPIVHSVYMCECVSAGRGRVCLRMWRTRPRVRCTIMHKMNERTMQWDGGNNHMQWPWFRSCNGTNSPTTHPPTHQDDRVAGPRQTAVKCRAILEKRGRAVLS
jgi:hypothetical protein